jgi:hypothetical protein
MRLNSILFDGMERDFYVICGAAFDEYDYSSGAVFDVIIMNC